MVVAALLLRGLGITGLGIRAFYSFILFSFGTTDFQLCKKYINIAIKTDVTTVNTQYLKGS